MKPEEIEVDLTPPVPGADTESQDPDATEELVEAEPVEAGVA